MRLYVYTYICICIHIYMHTYKSLLGCRSVWQCVAVAFCDIIIVCVGRLLQGVALCCSVL